MFWKEVFKYFDKYKTYLLLVIIVIILIFVFTPKTNVDLTNSEVKSLKKENKIIMQQYNANKDSILILRKENERLTKMIDSSKNITQTIKIITNEEVNRIPSIPFDTNVALFSRDLEEYLLNR